MNVTVTVFCVCLFIVVVVVLVVVVCFFNLHVQNPCPDVNIHELQGMKTRG